MGTRGSFGFIINDEVKTSYNHFDSYPDGQGSTLVENIRDINHLKDGWDILRKNVEKLEMVDEDSKPSPEIINEYEEQGMADISVADGTTDSWYCLLRNAQGGNSITLILDGNIMHMIHDGGFITNSLFCEYAYLVNLDTMCLDFYSGFQKKPQKGNRFGTEKYEGYYPCKLIHSYPLKDIITAADVKSIVKDMEKRADKDYKANNK